MMEPRPKRTWFPIVLVSICLVFLLSLAASAAGPPWYAAGDWNGWNPGDQLYNDGSSEGDQSSSDGVYTVQITVDQLDPLDGYQVRDSGGGEWYPGSDITLADQDTDIWFWDANANGYNNNVGDSQGAGPVKSMSWAGNLSPATDQYLAEGSNLGSAIQGDVYVQGLTDGCSATAGPCITAEVVYRPAGGSWTQSGQFASFSSDLGNNWQYNLTASSWGSGLADGTYDVALRFDETWDAGFGYQDTASAFTLLVSDASYTFHSIPDIDGDLDNWRVNEQLGSDNEVTYHFTWDETYLYVAFDGGNTASDRYNALIDVDPTSNGGATALFSGAQFPANGAPDYAVQWQSATDALYFATGSGASWTSGTTVDLSGDDNDGNPGIVELRIKRTKVGLSDPATPFALYLYVSNSSDDCWSAFPDNNPTSSDPDDFTTAFYYYESKSGRAPASAGLNAPFAGTSLATGDGSLTWVQHTAQRKLAYVNGKWWVVYRNGTGADIKARSSSDGGVTWSSEINVTNDGTSTADRAPTLWVEGDILHLAWVNASDDALYYNTIDTTGGSVGSQRTVVSFAIETFDGSELVALTQGSAGTLWAAINAASVYRSSDGGATWSQSPNPPADLVDRGSSLPTNYENALLVVPLPNGRMMAIASQTNRNYDYSVWDGAVGWTEWAALNPMSNEGVSTRNSECSAVVDYEGNVYFAHVSETGASSGTPDTLRIYKYTASTGIWEEISTITVSGADTLHFPALGINADDNLYLAYRQADNDSSDSRMIWRTSSDDGASWSAARLVGYTQASSEAYFDLGFNGFSDQFFGLVYRDTESDPVTPHFVLLDVLTAPRVPTLLSLFDGAKVTSLTPSSTFNTTDPGKDDVRYNIQIDDDPAFGSPLDRTSGTHSGFSNQTTPADTDPFNSGETVQFTVQAGDALSDGSTYYWRVRATDPNASTFWSGWSPPRSFTVDTGLDVTAWHQGTQGQFAAWARRSSALSTDDDRVRAGTRTEVSVSASGDDAYDDGTTNNTAGNDLHFPSKWLGGNYVTGMIFQSLPIPTDSPYVDSATVQLAASSHVANTAYPPPVEVRIWAENDADGQVASFSGSMPSSRAVGSMVADWPIDFLWGANAVVNSPELRSVVQEVVARSDWDANDDLDVLLKNNGSSGGARRVAISQDGGTAPKLYVTYVSNTVDGNAVSAPIVLADTFGGGASWGELYWHEEEPGSAGVKVSLYYRQSDGTMALVPDAALAGNSTGFDLGFVDINALNTSTYATLYIRAALSSDASAASPSLWWWSLTQHTASSSNMAVSRSISTDSNQLYTFGETGVRIYFGSDPPGSACSISVTVYRNTQHGSAANAVSRYYAISPSGCSNFSADMVLGYTTSELNGNTEANLKAYRWGGSSWEDNGGTVDSNANTVSVSSVTAFSDWVLDDQGPLAVELLSFAGRPAPGGILLSWETASEIDNLGFHLYRSVEQGVLGLRLNQALIPSKAPGSGQGASYEFLDTTARSGVSYYYTLEEVDADGTRTPHGPVGLTLWRIYMPLVFR